MAEDCGCGDEFAALATKTDEDLAADGPDPRGTKVTRWGPNLIAPYGKPTGDKRRFKAGALVNRELPLPLKWQREDQQGHQSSVVVGTLDGVEYTDDGVMGWGIMLDPDPEQLPRLAEDVAEAKLLLGKKVIGPSVDLDAMDYHPIGAPNELAAADTRPEIEVTNGRISAATLVPIPAFAEARPFTLTEIDAEEYAAMTTVTASGVRMGLDGLPVADTVWDPVVWLIGRDYSGALYETVDRVLFPVAQEVNGELSLIPGAVADAISVMAFQADSVSLGAGVKLAIRERLEELAAACELPTPPWAQAALVAAAGLKVLPAAVFADPKLDRPTAPTLETLPDGTLRIFGHLALWGTCHIGFPGACVTPPHSKSGYSYFHVGELDTDAGPLPVGKITLGGGHADTRLGFQAAAEHYDNTTTAVADARVGEDRFGIWFSGLVRPGLDERRVHELAVSPLSGDWRRVGGGMELVAALAVNTPGFTVPRVNQAGGRQYALVAAGSMAMHDEMVKADLTGKKKRKRKPEEKETAADAAYGDEDEYAADDDEELYFSSLSTEAREQAAKEKKANPDGSYPIRNVSELKDAISAFGRAKDKAQTKALIIRRARELKREDLIPDGWTSGEKSYSAEEVALAAYRVFEAEQRRERVDRALVATLEADLGELDRYALRGLAELF
jgi:hypothetical protein